MHATGAITNYIDVAQLVLYAFWIFFAGLVVYLTLESKREGFPLIFARSTDRFVGILPMPGPKVYNLGMGKTMILPHLEPEEIVNAAQEQPFEGAPFVPLGNPMQDGMGPAGYCLRPTEPEVDTHGLPRTVPLRVANDHWVASEDLDPRGCNVFTADGLVAGVCTDVWIDRAEQNARFLEVRPEGAVRGVIVPIELCQPKAYVVGGIIKVVSVTATGRGADPRKPGLSHHA
jgi:photosynthetic reaction center H subunit